MVGQPCAVDSCDRVVDKHGARGWCAMHYVRWQFGRDLNAPVKVHRRGSLEERFWPKVLKTETCWLWQGAVNAQGYGKIGLSGMRETRAAHRVAYELCIGPIPEGLHIDHLCRVRNCVRPDHLEAVTILENNLRSSRCGVTHCPHGHEYTPENTILCKGSKVCRECKRQRSREAANLKRRAAGARRRVRRAS